MSKITITILGTTAGVPTRERAHPAIYLSYDDGEETCILFDCGEGTQRQMLIAGLNLMKIDKVFITHWHGDHCLGLPGLVDTMGFEGRKTKLGIYAPEPARVRKVLDFSRSMSKFTVAPRKVSSKGKRVTTLLETDRFVIKSVPVSHGVPAVAYSLEEKDKIVIDVEKARSLGLPEKGEIYRKLKDKGKARFEGRKIELADVSRREKGKKIVYSGDTEICDNLREFVTGADLLIQDCTYLEDITDGKPHMHACLPEVIKMAEERGVSRTVLTHISRKYPDISLFRPEIEKKEGFELAEDFKRIVV
ncbi:MAG: MBL fold metallo-hydrolase [Candidatus Tantalella remota]|nr:MBL fold metallo-hydrolase [Candidatus Tantalella remota]